MDNLKRASTRKIVSSTSSDFESGKFDTEIVKLRDSFILCGQSADYAEGQVQELRSILSQLEGASDIDDIVALTEKWSSTLSTVKNELSQIKSGASVDKMAESSLNSYHSALDKYASATRASIKDESDETKLDKRNRAADTLLKEEEKLRSLAKNGLITNEQLEELINERDRLFAKLNSEKITVSNNFSPN